MPDLQCKYRGEGCQYASNSPHHRANAEESVTKVGREHLDRENVEAGEGDCDEKLADHEANRFLHFSSDEL